MSPNPRAHTPPPADPPPPTPADVAEPASYHLAFDRYVGDRPVDHESQTVVRPFNEMVGAQTSSLAFLRGSQDAASRVVLLRPVSGDPRPRRYLSDSALTRGG